MAGTIQFNTIPKLPDNWWDNLDDADTVWPTWGQYKSYFWGANSSNQFLKRGDSLMGGGLASSNGPSRGRAHPQYVGVDTMSSSSTSLAANQTVYTQMTCYLEAGHTLIVPIDLRSSLPDIEKAKFSLGTGIGMSQRDAPLIHSEIWAGILALVGTAKTVDYNSKMWTPDMSLPANARTGSRVALPDLAAMTAYHTKLKAAAKA